MERWIAEVASATRDSEQMKRERRTMENSIIRHNNALEIMERDKSTE